ncbi:superoxide dismutase [Cu-Zn] [Candidatus Regiella insecticola]|uniref:Superoxide dismutase [Cu-Zn] n=2 Tax=Candidatus Regiella insecticola TaxID=138073 RepID=A0A6L2ZRD7_9ENTR|nr:superoxide dismutase [Cu-Zn] [Candidatus Regiella insecticola]
MMKLTQCSAFLLLCFTSVVSANSLKVTMHEATTSAEKGKNLGTVTITETPEGLLFTPALSGLTPGIHGFHIHDHPNCAPGQKAGKTVPALQAGGHFDPNNKGSHRGPYDTKGHLGDLPGLVVNSDGTASYPVLAPRIQSLTEINHHALMIHVHGDNYSDHPEALGGGAARFACGVIQSE